MKKATKCRQFYTLSGSFLAEKKQRPAKISEISKIFESINRITTDYWNQWWKCMIYSLHSFDVFVFWIITFLLVIMKQKLFIRYRTNRSCEPALWLVCLCGFYLVVLVVNLLSPILFLLHILFYAIIYVTFVLLFMTGFYILSWCLKNPFRDPLCLSRLIFKCIVSDHDWHPYVMTDQMHW